MEFDSCLGLWFPAAVAAPAVELIATLAGHLYWFCLPDPTAALAQSWLWLLQHWRLSNRCDNSFYFLSPSMVLHQVMCDFFYSSVKLLKMCWGVFVIISILLLQPYWCGCKLYNVWLSFIYSCVLSSSENRWKYSKSIITAVESTANSWLQWLGPNCIDLANKWRKCLGSTYCKNLWKMSILSILSEKHVTFSSVQLFTFSPTWVFLTETSPAAC